MINIALFGLAILSSARPLNEEPIVDIVTNGFYAINATTGNTLDVDSGREPRKRGVSFNNGAYPSLFHDSNSRVAWKYNWGSNTGDSDHDYEFVPMLFNSDPSATSHWFDDVARCASQTNNGRMNVLSFNEPDQCGSGGACMRNVGDTVAAHRQWIEPLRKYGSRLKIISPAVTNGATTSAGPMGLDYLQQFLSGCSDCQIDYIDIHWYDKATNFDYFKQHISDAHSKFNKDIWITEFGPQGSDSEIQDFLQQALPWLDSQDYVYRYAMQWAGAGSLVNAAGNGLSSYGQTYNTL
ncbi:glycoside hydrolase family 128 protein [Lophiostoma macrostomum CBS 122681]|uniref:Glycoside hydrolase family 128 protein n=1 Tax=Lophiostoma macrostomum CBS 122681 TaxID=1314788 RepID=A0A6A6T8Y6_9PLEO|nr:glycoside hydrolase family 128 protein [Lophiostoma macrostomum CBS 122681]